MAHYAQPLANPPTISILVPCYNEAEVLPESLRRLHAAAEAANATYEIILVDDGSTDQTWDLIFTETRRDENVRGIRLSRNFGHQAAITAALKFSRGAEVLILDADLQDPPELLIPMRAKLAAGFDVVYGKRRSRAGESRLKLVTANLFYQVLGFLSDLKIPPNTGDFRLMSRRAVDAFLIMPEAARFIRGMVTWIGYRQTAFLYDRAPRAAGTPKYTFRKLLHLSLDGLTSFSIKPLRLATLAGGFLIFSSLLLAARVLYKWAQNGTSIHGWTSLIMTILFIGGIQTFILGVIGEYIARLYLESKRRPHYIVQDDTRLSAPTGGVSAQLPSP